MVYIITMFHVIKSVYYYYYLHFGYNGNVLNIVKHTRVHQGSLRRNIVLKEM
jgi:hypothetical protein